MDLVIRKAKIEDFPQVFSLFHQLWPNKEHSENAMKKAFDRGLKSKIDLYLCAEFQGNVVGFCAYGIMNNFWQEGQIAYVYTMIVDEGQRGKGIGSELLKEAFRNAKESGCKKVELDSAFHREKAHQFYTEKMGFEKRAFLFSKDLI